MSELYYKNIDGQNTAALIDWLVNPKAADPGTPTVGVLWYNTTDNRYRYDNGTSVQTIASLEDIAGIGNFKGGHDASTGNPPTAAPGDDISAGDFWRVTVGGTITGIQGADTVEPNDLIYALVDGATNASDFLAIEVNQDLASFVREETVAVASLPAVTATDVTPTQLTNSISSYIITTAAGVDITSGLLVSVDQTTPKITITSLLPLTNLSVKFAGT